MRSESCCCCCCCCRRRCCGAVPGMLKLLLLLQLLLPWDLARSLPAGTCWRLLACAAAYRCLPLPGVACRHKNLMHRHVSNTLFASIRVQQPLPNSASFSLGSSGHCCRTHLSQGSSSHCCMNPLSHRDPRAMAPEAEICHKDRAARCVTAHREARAVCKADAHFGNQHIAGPDCQALRAALLAYPSQKITLFTCWLALHRPLPA